MLKTTLPSRLEDIENRISRDRANLGKCMCPTITIEITAFIDREECPRCGDDMEDHGPIWICPSCRADKEEEYKLPNDVRTR